MKNKRGFLSLLLVFAMLIAGLATLLPVAAAEPEPEPEIQDLQYQSSADFSIGGESTDLRFLFTVGSLHYSEVGFVFSFEEYGNNKTPTIGGSDCYKVGTQTVYSSIRAGNETVEAPDGRWWVAVKLTDIPFANYYNWIYARAFVTDGEGTTYSDPVKLNVLKANRGSGESIHEVIGTSSTGENSNIQYKKNIYTDILNSGAKTFCPTTENPTGNDLLLEYSVLFNQYLADYIDNSNKPYVEARIANSNYSSQSTFSWWSPCDVCSGSDCAYAGGFDAIGGLNTVVSDEEVTTPAGMTSGGGSYSDYPNIGGADQANPEYGWHRIGIRIHEEVTALPTAVSDAEYLFTVTTYIDGRAVSKLQGLLSKPENYLYTATYNPGTGKVEYTDIGASKYVFIYRMKYKGITAENDKDKKFAYCVFADAYASCGKDFVQQVERIDPVAWGPDDGGYRTSNEKGIYGARYYRIVTPDHSDFPGSVSLMSYNVKIYGGKEGNLGWEGRHPEKVAETILSVSPDIVGLQEVNQGKSNGWNDTLDSLAATGGYTRLPGEYTGRSDFEKNEIFYKTSKFTLIAEGTKTFRQTASELGVSNPEGADPDISTVDRIFHYAVLQEKSTGKNILVVNVHRHYGGTGSGHEEDDKLRRYEIRALLAWLETQKTTYPNQIVMGDMNSHYKTGQGKVNMAFFWDYGFARTSSVAGVKYDVGGTLANERTTRQECVFDYILTKGSIDTAYYTVVPNPIDTDDTYPSDHIPILAKVYLR